MSEQKQVTSKRIQYSHDQEPSSLTIKNSLFDLLSKKKGSESEARKFCQASANKAKEENINSVSNFVFEEAFKTTIKPSILSQMTDDDFESKINERIQYSYQDDASSLTIKYALFKALSISLGSDKEAKKFCQNAAVEAKDSGTDVGRVSNFVFEKALEVVTA